MRQSIAAMSLTRAILLFLIRDLVDEDFTHFLSDNEVENYFSERDKELFSWIFERKVGDYLKTHFELPDIRHSYNPPYLRPNEIDLYAEKSAGSRRTVWIIECKFRFPPYPKQIKEEFLHQLKKNTQLVIDDQRPKAESEGESLAPTSILVTNGGASCSQEIQVLAKKLKIQMYYVDINPAKAFSRSKITTHSKICVINHQGETQ